MRQANANAFAFDRSSLSLARRRRRTSRRRSRRLVLPVFSKNQKVTVTHITYNTAVAADVNRATERERESERVRVQNKR